MTAGLPRQFRILVPFAALAITVVWVVGVGFRLDWWHTGNLDVAWNTWASGVVGAGGQQVAEVFAVVGTGVPALISAVALAGLIALRRGWAWGVAALAICAISALDVTLMKGVADRLRPDSAYGLHTSFPSGHTTNAAVLAALVAALLLEGGARMVPLLYPVLMAWSRTVLHAHWLSDVLAGCVLGVATVVLCTGVALLLIRRTGRRPRSWIESQRRPFKNAPAPVQK